MNATVTTTATTTPTTGLGTGLDDELDRLLALAAPVRTTAAASPLCLCWPDDER